MDSSKKPTVLSFCTGYGGLDLGLERAIGGMQPVAYVEIDAFACANLVAKMEAEQLAPVPIWTDLKTFPSREFRGAVDIITAGYPCQPFSVAGKQQGTEDSRHLWPDIERAISTIRPRAVFFENVPGIISAKTIEHRSDLIRHLAQLHEEADRIGGPDGWYLHRHARRLHGRFLKNAGISVLLYVLCRLESLGYRATAGMFTAAECGAPHQRKRVFIFGISDTNSSELSLCGNNERMGRQQQWPARPGPYQHEWEPPRTVGHTEGSNSAVANTSSGQFQDAGRESQARTRAGSTGEAVADGERDRESQSEGSQCDKRGRSQHSRQAVADTANDHRRSRERRAQEGVGARELRRRRSPSGSRQAIESQVGGDTARPTGRMDYAELCRSADSRIDELRLCGNGVVPAQAELAFRTLAGELMT